MRRRGRPSGFIEALQQQVVQQQDVQITIAVDNGHVARMVQQWVVGQPEARQTQQQRQDNDVAKAKLLSIDQGKRPTAHDPIQEPQKDAWLQVKKPQGEAGDKDSITIQSQERLIKFEARIAQQPAPQTPVAIRMATPTVDNVTIVCMQAVNTINANNIDFDRFKHPPPSKGSTKIIKAGVLYRTGASPNRGGGFDDGDGGIHKLYTSH